MIDSGFLGMGLVPLKKVKENSKKKNGQLDRQKKTESTLFCGAVPEREGGTEPEGA